MNQLLRVKDPKNQWRGKVNRAVGETFEKFINASCRYYQEEGLADIEKTPEPMRVVKNIGNGKFIARFEKKAQPDYKGVLRGGKTIVFEAKHTDDIRIDQNRLTSTQQEGLQKYEEMGAECYVLVSIQMQNFYFVPWVIWEAMKEIYGRKYMKEKELKSYQVPYGKGVIHFLQNKEVPKYREV